jgi:hypothetical protein
MTKKIKQFFSYAKSLLEKKEREIQELKSANEQLKNQQKFKQDKVVLFEFPEEIKVSNLKDTPEEVSVKNFPKEFDIANLPKEFKVAKPKWYKEPVEKIEVKNEIEVKKPKWIKDITFDEDSFLEKLAVLLTTVFSKTIEVMRKMVLTVRLHPDERKMPLAVYHIDPHTGKAVSPQQVIVHGGGGIIGGAGYIKNKSGALINPISEVETPLITALSLPTGNTPGNIAIPDGAKKIVAKLRDVTAGDLLMAWNDGDIAAGNYLTIPLGSTGREISGVNLQDKTIYFQCAADSQTVEIEIWT